VGDARARGGGEVRRRWDGDRAARERRADPEIMIAPLVLALAVAPPQGLTAAPKPADDGTHIVLAFQAAGGRYEVWRTADPVGASLPPDPAWTRVKVLVAPPGTVKLEDQVAFGRPHAYAVRALGDGEAGAWVVVGPVAPSVRWFDASRWFLFATAIAMAVLLGAFARRARRGKPGTVRRIPGIDAMEEAVGRPPGIGRPGVSTPRDREGEGSRAAGGVRPPRPL